MQSAFEGMDDVRTEYKIAQDNYMHLKRQQTRKEMGLAFEEGFDGSNLEADLKEAEEIFNEHVKRKVRAKPVDLSKKRDYSNYTCDDYERLGTFEERYDCMTAMMDSLSGKFLAEYAKRQQRGQFAWNHTQMKNLKN